MNTVNNLQIFNYQDNEVSFKDYEGQVYINATQMAKPFGKLVAGWLRNSQTEEFLLELTVMRKCITSDLVLVKQGGNARDQGTWMHEDVAIEFARWLNPRFAIWCNDRIKELFTHGITATEDVMLSILSDPSNAIKLLTALQEERKQKEMLVAQNELQSEQLKLSAPKVQYVDSVLQSNSTYTFTQIAKELDLSSANALTKRLKESEIIYRQSGQWMIASKYSGKGFTKTRTHQYVKSDGTSGTNTITVWTEKGREFIHKLINQKLYSYA